MGGETAAAATAAAEKKAAPSPGMALVSKFIVGGVACAMSSAILNPVDVVKVRLQVQKKKAAGAGAGAAGAAAGANGVRYRGFLHGVYTVYQQEGFRGLGKGLTASMMREMSYSSIRIGAYEPIRGTLARMVSVEGEGGDSTGGKRAHPFVKWGSALLSGGIGSGLANPTDLVKTRFQATMPGEPAPYPTTLNAFYTIYKTEGGIAGLYRGVTPTVARAALLTSAQVGSYDVIKNNLCIGVFGLKEGFALHFFSAMITGLVCTTASIAPDTIKSRYMSDAGAKYTGVVDCVVKTLRHEGPTAFLKGWTAAYWRLGPHTLISFLLMEKFRELLGMTTL